VSVSKMDDPGRRVRLLRLALLASASAVLLLSAPVVVYDLSVYWQGRRLIEALKQVEVGKTSGRDAIKLVGQFHASAYIVEERPLPNGSSVGFIDTPLTTCMAGDCYLSFYVSPGFPGLQSLDDLSIHHPGFRRYVPMNRAGGHLRVKQGIVQELGVTVESTDDRIQHSATTYIYSEYSHAAPWNRTPWSIRYVRAHDSVGGTTSDVRVEAWSSAPKDRLLSVFDFSLNCLLLGVHCSRCQILPRACEDYEHGNWYEFTMPPKALRKFRQAVNDLKLGTPVYAITDQLGEGAGIDMQRQIRDLARDRLPFDFPDGSITSSSDENLVYYVKRWRLHPDSPKGTDDQSVTFVFDKDRRLLRIESHVEGIVSR